MEAQEEVIVMGSKENTHIVKGKRTKRQRPQSPIPFAMISTTANSPTGEGGGAGTGGGIYGEKNCNIDTINDDMNTSFSPATSTELLQDSTTEEEEDMANCLILLAQGQTRPETPRQVEVDHGGGGGAFKFNSRRFLEAAATGTGKAGYYVYECKTCKRTFPSFQALGGHRASHKKPKAMAAAEERERSSKQFLLSSDDDQEAQSKKNDLISSLSLQLSSSSRGLGSNNNRSKVHECSVCGAEFTSGQALGGHMRRHRAPNMGTNTTLSFTSPSLALEPDHHHDQETKRPRQMLSLDLDLNLPAPEDDHREPKFSFATKQQQQKQQQQPQQQQQPLVFSARTLVDCHY
ncbi:hypothetical protein F2P56_028304 [Juglans regia]|uniref:C2H2-type domain-containing protein n=2 Tax=Juglans regia TaxID=51240 RepID=A0A833X943_JUGRE|nr:zinc finger protein ZAT5-like [Juglans regia]KAF5453400.1 hypothetical protein F2P56_028304 [Juglans regia]